MSISRTEIKGIQMPQYIRLDRNVVTIVNDRDYDIFEETSEIRGMKTDDMTVEVGDLYDPVTKTFTKPSHETFATGQSKPLN